MSSASFQLFQGFGRRKGWQERRRRVLRAAVEVFTRPGRRRDDVAEIARRAGVGKATLYREFGSRNGILVEVAKHGTEELLSRMVAAVSAPGEVDVVVREAIRTALAFFDEQPALARILVLECNESREPVLAHYLDHYARSRAAAEPLFDARSPPAALADRSRGELIDVLMYLITGRLFFWVVTGQRSRLEDDTHLLADAYLGGVVGAKREGA